MPSGFLWTKYGRDAGLTWAMHKNFNQNDENVRISFYNVITDRAAWACFWNTLRFNARYEVTNIRPEPSGA